MGVITAKKVEIDGEEIRLSSRFRKFYIRKGDIKEFRIKRIPSLFDEIGIEFSGEKTFLVSERARGFFDLTEFLNVETVFGAFWYRDAEDGRELRHKVLMV
ncbi:hypothetical protein DVR09_08465 [Erythrobacter aureus]|uniref:Uncharacterized protein n=2 Tax=Erythrobacter aureus TaxID=2182384 RepID=A0A345YEL3_9SPHN|nr:hypothetical protein DVR09_08465 [Erythrobacter aureus]